MTDLLIPTSGYRELTIEEILRRKREADAKTPPYSTPPSVEDVPFSLDEFVIVRNTALSDVIARLPDLSERYGRDKVLASAGEVAIYKRLSAKRGPPDTRDFHTRTLAIYSRADEGRVAFFDTPSLNPLFSRARSAYEAHLDESEWDVDATVMAAFAKIAGRDVSWPADDYTLPLSDMMRDDFLKAALGLTGAAHYREFCALSNITQVRMWSLGRAILRGSDASTLVRPVTIGSRPMDARLPNSTEMDIVDASGRFTAVKDACLIDRSLIERYQ